MFFLLMSFFPFALLLSMSLPFQSLLPWAGELRVLSALLWQQLLSPLRHLLDKCRPVTTRKFAASPSTMVSSRNVCARRVENREESGEPSVLDLPELALECILGKLSPAGLANMAAVCSSLRERCRSDHLWEKHMREKWGRVIGRAAGKQWKLYLASAAAKGSSAAFAGGKIWIGFLYCAWPITWLRDRTVGASEGKNLPPDGSLMSWYQSLESGKLWFPAQVYNREHGHLGFVLSCYDAEVSYDCSTDTFNARYPPHGWRTVVTEEEVEWNRLRAPPVNTSAHELHISDCLSDLRPGDHIEIQWRRNKEFPYGWWYGIIGHLESCNGNERFCRCHSSNTIVLEFGQYTPGSRWRQTLINRKDHREEGNETDGFYGGIRKLQSKEEISKWRELSPTDVLE